jgi:hypothetical protein
MNDDLYASTTLWNVVFDPEESSAERNGDSALKSYWRNQGLLFSRQYSVPLIIDEHKKYKNKSSNLPNRLRWFLDGIFRALALQDKPMTSMLDPQCLDSLVAIRQIMNYPPFSRIVSEYAIKTRALTEKFDDTLHDYLNARIDMSIFLNNNAIVIKQLMVAWTEWRGLAAFSERNKRLSEYIQRVCEYTILINALEHTWTLLPRTNKIAIFSAIYLGKSNDEWMLPYFVAKDLNTLNPWMFISMVSNRINVYFKDEPMVDWTDEMIIAYWIKNKKAPHQVAMSTWLSDLTNHSPSNNSTQWLQEYFKYHSLQQ